MKKRLTALMMILALLLLTLPAAGAEGEPFTVSTMNGDAVQNGVNKLNRISIDANSAPVLVERIATYHWNNGTGTAAPGQIKLYEYELIDGAWKATRICGTWQAEGQSGGGNAKNAYWVVYPNITLEPGHSYAVMDTDLTTWSQNEASGGFGMCEITGHYLSSQSTGGGSLVPDSWNCPVCGQEGNTGNFCFNCGTARPAASGAWTCPNCGQTGNTGKFCPNCGASQSGGNSSSRTQQPAQQQTVNTNLEQIPGESERVKVRLAGVDASSYLSGDSNNPMKWAPANAADGNETTCWQHTAKKGAWLELATGSGEAVDEIWFKNGFWAYNTEGKDQYSINARPKDIRVQFLYNGENQYRDELAFTLRDEWGTDWQRFSVGHHTNVAAVRIVINSSYQGSRFKKDVCLSEVMLVQVASSAIAMPAQGQQTAVVYESRPDVTGCSLLMRLSTRSGPGTQYAEPGTFFQNTWQEQTVLVYKKSFADGVWWVQVDFRNGNKSSYRVWTGVKRVNVDLNKVPQEVPIGECDIAPTSETYWGPGGNYAKAGVAIGSNAIGVLYQIENGWCDVEYYSDSGTGRVWVPRDAVYNIDTSTDRSGEG